MRDRTACGSAALTSSIVPSPGGTSPSRSAQSLVLALSDVAVRIGTTRVLEGLDLQLRPGESLGIRGANGSGKSTLLRVCATLLRPRAGSVQILGLDRAEAVAPAYRRQICLIGHEPGLYAQLSVRENLRFVARLYDRDDAAVDEALEVVGLTRAAGRRLDRCSQGMVRRADLARVLIARPRLLLLDEAHAGLDAAANMLVGHLIGLACRAGGAAVVVAHDEGRLTGQATRTATLTSGRLVPDEGTP